MNIPNIEFREKFLTFFGLAIAVFAFIEREHIGHELNLSSFELSKSIHIYNKQVDRVNMMYKQQNQALQNANNQISANLDSIDKNKSVNGVFQKKINEGFEQLDKLLAEQSVTQKKENKILEDLRNEMELIKNKDSELHYTNDYKVNLLDTLIIIGGILFILGLVLWGRKEQRNEELIIRQNIDKPTFSDNCQCCGKKFNSMITYSNEIDGTKNYHFCNNCYKDGAFTYPDLTLVELKSITKKYLEKNNFKENEIKKVLNKLDKLDRWNLQVYGS